MSVLTGKEGMMREGCQRSDASSDMQTEINYYYYEYLEIVLFSCYTLSHLHLTYPIQ